MSLTGHHAASSQAPLGQVALVGEGSPGYKSPQSRLQTKVRELKGASVGVNSPKSVNKRKRQQKAATAWPHSLAPLTWGAASSPAAAVTWGSLLGAASWEPCPLPLRGSLLCQCHRGPLRPHSWSRWVPPGLSNSAVFSGSWETAG